MHASTTSVRHFSIKGKGQNQQDSVLFMHLHCVAITTSDHVLSHEPWNITAFKAQPGHKVWSKWMHQGWSSHPHCCTSDAAAPA
jgi:hypothetical protein